ncbi:coiled-coil domain-containing protein 40-like [Entelurus aequoreus]|uniref:coiled-coil domain-containing protein 40-like n=1 Tax=Entelurus aequoreus TaxID=161455 RepID=UPI002B1E860F|nr:coiled-coil domain-containing protein 40-like [Entelurus aequoreus]
MENAEDQSGSLGNVEDQLEGVGDAENQLEGVENFEDQLEGAENFEDQPGSVDNGEDQLGSVDNGEDQLEGVGNAENQLGVENFEDQLEGVDNFEDQLGSVENFEDQLGSVDNGEDQLEVVENDVDQLGVEHVDNQLEVVENTEDQLEGVGNAENQLGVENFEDQLEDVDNFEDQLGSVENFEDQLEDVENAEDQLEVVEHPEDLLGGVWNAGDQLGDAENVEDLSGASESTGDQLGDVENVEDQLEVVENAEDQLKGVARMKAAEERIEEQQDVHLSQQDEPRSEPADDLSRQLDADEEAGGTPHTELEGISRVLSSAPLPTLVEENIEEESVMDPEEEEEFLVLDAEHPLIAKKQAALKHQLVTELERLTMQLKEKTADDKAESSKTEEIFVKLFREQERLKGLQTRLECQEQTKVLAESKHRQVQDQLMATKACHTSITNQCNKTKADVSKLQAELDKLRLHVIFTQAVTADLHSNVKATKSATRKVGTKKSQAEDQKLKQDMYVERLTKELERLTQLMDVYEAQTNAQAETTHATQEALSEAEMQMESLAMAQKQLLQQWNSSLLSMRRQDEEFGTMQEAVRIAEHQVIVLDREIEGNKKSISELQERSETLTMLLNCSQMDCDVSKKMINQKQAQHEALQAQYSTYVRALGETERILAELTKEDTGLQTVLTDQRRKLEKNKNKHLELEEGIMTRMLQKLMDSKAAQHYQRLTNKKASLKKEKIFQLWHLESSVMAAALQSNVISEKLANLSRTQKGLDEEITKYNKVVQSNQTNSSSIDALIGQKQTTVANINKKIDLIAARTGHEDLSPLQIKVQGIKTQIDEVSLKIKKDQQLWLKHQGMLVGLTLEIQEHSKEYNKLQAKLTVIRQKKIYLECHLEVMHREESDIDKSNKMLQRDLLKLNTLLSKNTQLRQALEQENMVMETKFLHELKEAERQSIEMEVKLEKTQEEKEKLLSSLVEAERQIMLWEKKTHLMKETRLVVEEGQEDIQIMKDDIHRMERWLSQLMRQRETLLRDSVAVVERRGNIIERNEVLARSTKKIVIKGELHLMNDGLRRKIKDTQKLVKEYSQEIRELQEGHEEFQKKSKKIQEMTEGTPVATASLEVTLQSELELVNKVSTIVHRVWTEMPKYHGALWKIVRSLAENTDTEVVAH